MSSICKKDWLKKCGLDTFFLLTVQKSSSQQAQQNQYAKRVLAITTAHPVSRLYTNARFCNHEKGFIENLMLLPTGIWLTAFPMRWLVKPMTLTTLFFTTAVANLSCDFYKVLCLCPVPFFLLFCCGHLIASLV